MSIDFHAQENRYTYASRRAHPDWATAIRSIIDPAGKRVADIGCGGGIYSAAWADIGAGKVTGVDFSAQMVLAATEKNNARENMSFTQGNALDTGLPSASADIVFERALIHHLTDYEGCFDEARRVLAGGGQYIIQDRTPDDVALPGSRQHIRGYFFECFPELLDVEIGRRPTLPAVEQALRSTGFEPPQVITVWETRRRYESFADLSKDLSGRVGRSILHNLDDAQLKQLVRFIGDRIPTDAAILEQDRWTIWSARKP